VLQWYWGWQIATVLRQRLRSKPAKKKVH
jgi:hypothetical protein